MAVGPLFKVVSSAFTKKLPENIEVRCEITDFTERELEVLFRVIGGLMKRDVRTVRYVEGKLVKASGIIVDKWSSKKLEGDESVINAVLPIVVDNEYSIWYQSFHPWGGVPDIMIDVGEPQIYNDRIYFNGKVAWYIARRGKMVNLIPGEWYPKVVIEVKSGKCRRVRNYVAERKILIGCEQEGWLSVPWSKVEEVGEVVKRVM